MFVWLPMLFVYLFVSYLFVCFLFCWFEFYNCKDICLISIKIRQILNPDKITTLTKSSSSSSCPSFHQTASSFSASQWGRLVIVVISSHVIHHDYPILFYFISLTKQSLSEKRSVKQKGYQDSNYKVSVLFVPMMHHFCKITKQQPLILYPNPSQSMRHYTLKI